MFLKKKKNKEKLIRKKNKELKKNTKKFHDICKWVKIEEVGSNYIKIDNKQYVCGLKIVPPKISLLDDGYRNRLIEEYANIISSVDFEVYHIPIKSPINVDQEINELRKRMAKESDPVRIDLFNDEIEIYENLAYQNLKSEYFEIVAGDINNNYFLKKLDDFVRAYQIRGFEVEVLNSIDFDNLLAYVFENNLINDFYFSRGLFYDENQEDMNKEGDVNV